MQPHQRAGRTRRTDNWSDDNRRDDNRRDHNRRGHNCRADAAGDDPVSRQHVHRGAVTMGVSRAGAGRSALPPARGARELERPGRRDRVAADHGDPTDRPGPPTGCDSRDGRRPRGNRNRGTGRAEPSLDCPEFQSAWLANLQRADSFDVERTAIVDAYTACRVRLEAAGVDFDDYDTEANVRDLDAIRAALGYEQWNIWGFSYGARLTLAAMRSTPDSIRSVILDSVYDVTRGILAASRDGGERALAELAVGCSEQPGCAAKHPDLAAEIAAVDRRYNDDPATVEVDLGDGNGPRTFLVTGDDIMSGLLLALYDATIIPLLPDLIGGLADGDTSILGEFVRRGVAMQAMFAAGMRLSVNCADNAGLDPRIDEDAIDDPGRLALLLTEPLCSEWPVEPTSPDFNVPIESDIPALVMAGRYDPVTPPTGTEAVADRLSNATFGLWPDRGHGVSGEPCSNDISTAFLEDPTASVDLECLAAIDGPAFG